MTGLNVEPLGEREMTTRIIYTDKADLVAKLQAMSGGIDNGSFPANKPIWAATMNFNCCGGSPP